jgi:prepilin-type N-terminal cleavage/methylation domain-containing protein
VRTGYGRRGEAGFTLIETLVTLAVVGFLVILTSTVLRTTSSTLNTVSRADAESDVRSSDASFLRRVLAHAQPDFAADSRKGIGSFEGSRMQARFLAPSNGRGGVYDIVRYDLHNDERGRLHVTWRLDRPADQDALSVDDVVPEVRIIGLSYFGVDRTSGTSRWIDRWQNRDDLPRAVKLSIEIHGRLTEMVTSLLLADASERD